ncbi:MAG: putative toxin-antitoxin system toxin component, PIN family [Oscillospiraceae bacterium]|nr:putative toxin-antitoxin system toxin component, PIN family [Oscillospiraceae bacterium]
MNNGEKVVIDTNVLVSALWSENGNSAEIIKMIPNDIVPCFGDSIFEEYTEVLNRPKFAFSTNKKEELLAKMKEFGEAVTPEKSDIPLPDETDRVFYDTATASGATLITGNKKDYPDEPFILTPAEFLRKKNAV